MAWPEPTTGASAGKTGAQDRPILPADAHPRGVGTTLREARDRRAWTIAQVADYLRIRPAVLEAMEAGQFEKLPTGAYALGFVRTYADFLGLDRDEIIRRVKAEAAAVAARTELLFPMPIAESRLPSGLVLGLSVALAIGAYGLWYYQSANTGTLARVEAVPERMAALVDRAPTNSTSPSKAEAATPAPGPAAAVAEPVPASPPELASASSSPAAPSSAAPVPVTPAANPVPASDPQIAALPVPATEQPRDAAAPRNSEAASPKQFGDAAGARIVVKATADSWVQVRDPAGAVVFSRILRNGDSYAAPNRVGFKLATGSAGVLDISVDGQKAPPIGRPGFTRRDVLLDPARLLAGTAVPEVPPVAAASSRPAGAAPAARSPN
jgi:cytoskeleton protein RodZ